MSEPPSRPLPKIWIARPWDKGSMLLLLLLWLRVSYSCSSWLDASLLLPLLLLLPQSGLLLTPPRCLLLPLLAVHDEEHEGSGKAENDDTLHDAVVNIQRVTARHLILVHVLVQLVIVKVVILQKVVDPIAK